VKYPAYPVYKDSGIEWLGSLPEGWIPTRVRFLLKDGSNGIKIGPFGSALKLEEMVENGIKVYGQENVIANDFNIGKRFLSDDKFREMSVYETRHGDILITMMGSSGQCQIVPSEAKKGIIDSHLIRLRVKTTKATPKYFRLLIDESATVKFQIQILGKGSIMHGLNSGIIKDLFLPLPSTTEQTAIASFLDRETAKIDHLISKQQELISLLQEKRQAVISHAVTKGLNPDVPMKDSGVEWLGEVPEHWNVCRIANVYSERIEQGHDDLPILSISIHSGISDKELSSDELDKKVVHIEDKTKYKRVYINDLAYNMMRAWQGGFGAVQVEGLVSPAYVVARPKNDSFDSKYIEKVLRTGNCVEEMRRYSKGITDFRSRLYWDHFKNIRIPGPQKEEQAQILQSIEDISEKTDRLINKANDAIALMKERRAALISAAVTGKIDVRNA
jgi:type I restriction enzyme, S subunit